MKQTNFSNTFGGAISLGESTDIERRKAELLSEGFTLQDTQYGVPLEEVLDEVLLEVGDEIQPLVYQGPHFSHQEVVGIVEVWTKRKQFSRLQEMNKAQAISRVIDLSSTTQTLMKSRSGKEYTIFYEKEGIEGRSIKAISIEGEIFFLQEIVPLLDGGSIERKYVHAHNPLIELSLYTQVENRFEKTHGADHMEEVRRKIFHKPKITISRDRKVTLRGDILIDFLPDGL